MAYMECLGIARWCSVFTDASLDTTTYDRFACHPKTHLVARADDEIISNPR